MEVKNCNNISIPRWWRQVKSDCKTKIPTLVFKLVEDKTIIDKNGDKRSVKSKRWLVALYLEDWLETLKPQEAEAGNGWQKDRALKEIEFNAKKILQEAKKI